MFTIYYRISLKQTLLYSLLLFLCACRSTNYLSSIQASKQSINAKLALSDDAAITALIQPYKEVLDQQMQEVIGTSNMDLSKKRPESTLGNWMADAIQRQAEKELGQPIAFAIQNYGGIRIPSIKKGLITRRMIYELMPFDNSIIILALEDKEIQELLQHIVHAGGWPISHSAKVQQVNQDSINILIHNKPLVAEKKYLVALPDYVANGGSDAAFLKSKTQQQLNLFIRDALLADVVEHAKKNRPISSEIEGRIVLNEN